MGRRRALKRATEFGYELAGEAKDGLASMLLGDPANMEVYDPGLKQRIPEAGAWGLITRKLPPLEGGVDKEIRVGRIFYLERAPAQRGRRGIHQGRTLQGAPPFPVGGAPSLAV